jgi:hypothetical protein
MKIFCDDIGVLLLNQPFSDRLICIFLSDTMAKDDVTVIDNIHSYNWGNSSCLRMILTVEHAAFDSITLATCNGT